MSLRTRILALVSAAGAIALAGTAIAGLGVSAQTPATATPVTSVGGPQGVPLGRFFGTITTAGASTAAGTTIVATIGTATCGTYTIVSAGSYQIDIQALPGCNPGATVSFSVNGRTADQTGTVPSVSGAVQLNLTVTPATPTPAPTATPAPPPPPPAPTARPTATAVVTPAPTAIVPVNPPNTGLGGTSQQKPAGPAVAQKPGAAAPARPALPNTGTGGLSNSGPLSGLLLLGALFALAGAGSLSLIGRRR